jgi:hypothetical protein
MNQSAMITQCVFALSHDRVLTPADGRVLTPSEPLPLRRRRAAYVPGMSVGQFVKVAGISRNAASKYKRLFDTEAEQEGQMAV